MSISSLFKKITHPFAHQFLRIESKLVKKIEEASILNANVMIQNMRSNGAIKDLADAEFKVFSQWGEDGIIQYLISKIPIPNKLFVEFGVENYSEANTRFLLVNNNWSGLVMDSNQDNINQIKRLDLYWRYDHHRH